MPLGGYKGSGLAMMVEILCAVLSGGAMSTEVGGIRFRGKCPRQPDFLAIDIARFMPVAEFTARVAHLVEVMKSTPTAPGYDEVLVAGEPEWRMEAERRATASRSPMAPRGARWSRRRFEPGSRRSKWRRRPVSLRTAFPRDR